MPLAFPRQDRMFLREAVEVAFVGDDSGVLVPCRIGGDALAHVIKLAPTLPRDNLLVMNLCGRGDKDVFAVAGHLGLDIG